MSEGGHVDFVEAALLQYEQYYINNVLYLYRKYETLRNCNKTKIGSRVSKYHSPYNITYFYHNDKYDFDI